jgi:NAD(P)-dependent dehydrogenase (short-subunit alcohol dehydrogenase family)
MSINSPVYNRRARGSSVNKIRQNSTTMPYLTRSSVVLITASSAGLGAATARELASNGVRVIINYLSSREKAEALVEELSLLDHALKDDSVKPFPSQSPRFVAIQADVSRRIELIRLVEESVAAMGRLDIVVSNHDWTKIRDFHNLDDNMEESDWDNCFTMNVKSHLFLFHASRKHLEATEGAFITTASLAGVVPSGSSLVRTLSHSSPLLYL